MSPRESTSAELGCFQILDLPEPIGRQNQILGCIVPSKYSTNPFDGRRPYWKDPKWENSDSVAALKSLQETLDFFWEPAENGIALTDVIAHRGLESATEGSVKVTQALVGYANGRSKQGSDILAGEARLYKIDNADGAVKKRLAVCKPWLNELQEAYNDDDRKAADKRFYIVTGIYTCKDMLVGFTKEKSSGAGGAVGVPGKVVAEALAPGVVPSRAAELLDVKVGVDKSNGSDMDVSAKIPDEIIFAIRYHTLDITFEDAERKPPSGLARLKFWGKSEPHPSTTIKSVSLGKLIRGPGGINAYGSAEDDMFYWKKPVYALPDPNQEIPPTSNVGNGQPTGPQTNGGAH